MSEHDDVALMPVAESESFAPTEALLAVYKELPGDVVAFVEFERISAIQDNLDHLRRIRDKLAPFGNFKAWCLAAGLNYGTISNRLSRADKPAVNRVLTERLLSYDGLTAARAWESVLPGNWVRDLLLEAVSWRPIREFWMERDPNLYEFYVSALAWDCLRIEYVKACPPPEGDWSWEFFQSETHRQWAAGIKGFDDPEVLGTAKFTMRLVELTDELALHATEDIDTVLTTETLPEIAARVKVIRDDIRSKYRSQD